eukprot:scaffold1896_cov121-Isochrysis_galbana.AAC.15
MLSASASTAPTRALHTARAPALGSGCECSKDPFGFGSRSTLLYYLFTTTASAVHYNDEEEDGQEEDGEEEEEEFPWEEPAASGDEVMMR